MSGGKIRRLGTVMRIRFSRLLLSVMLILPSSAGVLAQSSSGPNGPVLRKEKAQIVVVNKRERDKQQTADEAKKAKSDKHA